MRLKGYQRGESLVAKSIHGSLTGRQCSISLHIEPDASNVACYSSQLMLLTLPLATESTYCDSCFWQQYPPVSGLS